MNITGLWPIDALICNTQQAPVLSSVVFAHTKKTSVFRDEWKSCATVLTSSESFLLIQG
jgi:hypothetical protein